jgi:ankyrin repeat protein
MSTDHFDVKSLFATEIRQLIEANFGDVKTYRGKDGATALHIMGDNDDNAEIVKVLISMGADVDNKTDRGVSPLHWAISQGNGNIEIVKVLVSQRANVNIKDNYGITPLHLAAFRKLMASVEIAKILVTHGADINAKTNVNAKGLSATPLEYAKQVNHTAMIQYLSSIGARWYNTGSR